MTVDLSRLQSLAEAALATSYDERWKLGYETRTNARAIKSGIYTVLTIGDYFDGGSDEQESALTFIASADPVTVLALVRIAQAAADYYAHEQTEPSQTDDEGAEWRGWEHDLYVKDQTLADALSVLTDEGAT